jgi:hypothetical protein
MHYEICDYLMDIFQNAVESGADTIELTLVQNTKNLTVGIRDNGRGMSEDQVNQALDPFYSDGVKHPGRRVGLGLPFLVQVLQATGGDFSIASTPGLGTELSFSFQLDSIDTPPMGDLVFSLVQMMSYPGDHLVLVHRKDLSKGIDYQVNRNELHEALGGMDDPEALGLAEAFFKSQEEIDG